jgi:type III secretion protein U
MSGESSSGEKTEPPTPKRLRDAREKGQVARSKEIAGTLGLTILLAYVWFRADSLREAFAELIFVAANAASLPFAAGLGQMADAASTITVQLIAPVIGIAIVAAILGNIVQIGALFAFEAVKPSLNKLNPASALKKIVSAKNFLDFGKNIIKTALLSLVLLLVIRYGIGDLVRAGACGLGCTVAVFSRLMAYTIALSMFIFVAAAGVDYALERWQYMKGLKMTKDEVKREYKEMEGDPHIKGRRRQLHHELATSDAVQSTQRATAVVTNPTHLAVALRYDREEAPLPVVLAKGENLIARRIIEAAERFDVPVMQNIDLARALYDRGEIDQLIPQDLIEPVAEVLRWVRRLARERATV